ATTQVRNGEIRFGQATHVHRADGVHCDPVDCFVLRGPELVRPNDVASRIELSDEGVTVAGVLLSLKNAESLAGDKDVPATVRAHYLGDVVRFAHCAELPDPLDFERWHHCRRAGTATRGDDDQAASNRELCRP